MNNLTVERHDEIMDLMSDLYMYWARHSELRLGQILYNFAPQPNSDVYYTVDSYYRIVLKQANREEGTK